MSDSKLPRDWLLARHASAKPRLDAARRVAVAACEMSWREFLRAIFRPYLMAWRALALVWLGLLFFQLTVGRSPQPNPVRPAAPDAMATWLAQFKANEYFAQIDRHP
jgi:hypothetical protein